jgi:hypothetical protein
MVPAGIISVAYPISVCGAEPTEVSDAADYIIEHGTKIGEKHSLVEKLYDTAGEESGSVYLSVKAGENSRSSFIVIVQTREAALILRDDNLDGLLDSSEENGVPLRGKDAKTAECIFDMIVGRYSRFQVDRQSGI